MPDNEFDINDPNLVLELPEGYDPEAELTGGTLPPPPPDGVNKVALYLAEDTEQKSAVRFSKGKVAATFRVRAVKEDGEPGAYLKDYHPTSQVFDGQRTSALANLCNLAGKPVRTNQPGAYIEHVKSVFNPEEPFFVQARTQWVKSTPAIDPETGEHKIDPQTGYKEYVEVKGRAKITQAAVQAAQVLAFEQGLDEDDTQAAITRAAANPHLYIDPITGDEKSVRAEVRFVVGK